MATVFLPLSALCLWILSRDAILADPPLIRAPHDLVYLTGGPAHVLSFAPFLAASAVALVRSGVLPKWIAVLGVAAAVPALPSAAAFLWEPAAFLLPLGRVLTYGWIFAISVDLLIS